MIRITEFAFIVYPVTDESQAREFYEGVLGLVPGMTMRDEEHGQFWVEYEVGPHVLGIGNEPFLKPSKDGAGPQLVFEVADLDEAVAHLKEHGVPFASEVMEMPGCRAVIVEDPDGNRLGMHQRKGDDR